MKRSTGIVLVAMASLCLASCSDPSYQSVEECVLNGHHSTEDCRAAYLKALERHNAEAPRYATSEECETVTEPMPGAVRCEPVGEANFTENASDVSTSPSSTSHGSGYHPRFSSFALGSWSSGGAHPVYHDSHGALLSAHSGGAGGGSHGSGGEGIGHAGSAHASSGHGSSS